MASARPAIGSPCRIISSTVIVARTSGIDRGSGPRARPRIPPFDGLREIIIAQDHRRTRNVTTAAQCV